MALTDEGKRCDLLKYLGDDRWREFELKAQQEWKLSIGIWSALVVGIGILFKGEAKDITHFPKITLFITAALLLSLIVFSHFKFLLWIQTRMNQLRESMNYIDTAILSFAGIAKAPSKNAPNRSRWRQPPMYVQIGITALLGLLFILLLIMLSLNPSIGNKA
jgi:hypothetical protein